jgi:hypothetical protein
MDLVHSPWTTAQSRFTVDRWAEVAGGLPECSLAIVSVARVSPRGAGKVEGT